MFHLKYTQLSQLFQFLREELTCTNWVLGPHGDGTKAMYAPMKPQQQAQQQQHQHPFLHAHPSLEFAAAPHHHHHHGYGTLPPGSLPPLAGLPGMQPAGRGPPTLLDRSHARMIPRVNTDCMKIQREQSPKSIAVPPTTHTGGAIPIKSSC